MGRAPCCEKNGLKKGPWTPEEDQLLIEYIKKNGSGNWRTLPKHAGLQRCGKSCRLRWTNYLRPDIKRGKFSFEEEETIIQLHTILGNKWSAIAARLPGRTDNEIKNYWNTHIRKKLLQMGIDPITHNIRLDLLHFPTTLNSTSFLRMHPLINHNNFQTYNQIPPPLFQDFAIPATCLDSQAHLPGFGSEANEWEQNSESMLSTLTEDFSLPVTINGYCGLGQPVLDPSETCTFQSSSSNSFSFHSVLSSPFELQ